MFDAARHLSFYGLHTSCLCLNFPQRRAPVDPVPATNNEPRERSAPTMGDGASTSETSAPDMFNDDPSAPDMLRSRDGNTDGDEDNNPSPWSTMPDIQELEEQEIREKVRQVRQRARKQERRQEKRKRRKERKIQKRWEKRMAEREKRKAAKKARKQDNFQESGDTGKEGKRGA